MYHGLVNIFYLDTTLSHLRSHGHNPNRFNHAGWDKSERTTANLNNMGYLRTISNRRFSRRQLVNLIEDSIAFPGVSYIEGVCELFEKSYRRRTGRKVYWDRGGNLRRQKLYRVRIVTILGTDRGTGRRYYRPVTGYPI